ncbi:histidinol-phosphatase HisJ [Cohnella sp. AR92]|nr:histidinol-phosphatase HisJ [Cohnella sp. AR92]RUS45586.1 histidinol-phosphatase HisJ [Cohnella sp. AR92]
MRVLLKWDGHTHSKFCYHGNPAEQKEYLERAIELGFERYSVTEHPPLPDKLVDNPQLMLELAMPAGELADYFAYMKDVKASYEGRIEVAVGLEMDYLFKRTDFSDRIIDNWAKQMEDAVVSVHYLPSRGGAMRCIDYTADDFRDAFLGYYGSIDKVVEEYFNHVEMEIEWAAQLPMRKRIGHVNLIRKFHKELPEMDPDLVRRRLEGLLPKLKASGIGVDVNVAGFRVATCEEAYVPEWFMQACRENGIELVYGSDSHKPEQVGFSYDWFAERAGK